MTKLVLTYIGTDDWSRPVYKDESGRVFKDTNLGDLPLDLCTASDFYGEPDTPISYIKKYKDLEVELIQPYQPTQEEKFNYQMLSRLQSDCDYYLGNGNEYTKLLWAGNVTDQIKEMKKIYSWFEYDKKPEWLTWDEILGYENKMIGRCVNSYVLDDSQMENEYLNI